MGETVQNVEQDRTCGKELDKLQTKYTELEKVNEELPKAKDKVSSCSTRNLNKKLKRREEKISKLEDEQKKYQSIDRHSGNPGRFIQISWSK